MRIVMIPMMFLPHHSGGAEVWMSGIGRELQRQGHQVSVFTAEDSAFQSPGGSSKTAICDDYWEELPVRRVYYDKVKTGYPAPWYDTLNPAIAAALSEYLRALRPDVVHLTCGHHLSASPILAAKRLGLPVVLTLVDHWYICPIITLMRPDDTLCSGRKSGIECLGCLSQHSRIHRMLTRAPEGVLRIFALINQRVGPVSGLVPSLRLVRAVEHRNKTFTQILRKVDRILAPSRSLLGAYVACGSVTPEQISYSPHGIDLQYAAKGKLKSASATLRLGYTGHILRGKGVHVLIQAVRSLTPEMPVELRVWGSLERDPEYGRELVALAENDPRIHFFGPFDNHRIGDILGDIDTIVAPSIWVEASPIVIHEALAAHTPAIATNLGGLTDLIQHETNGLLFERGNVADLAAQITRLVCEPGLLTRLSANARPIRSVADEANALAALYRELAAARQLTHASCQS